MSLNNDASTMIEQEIDAALKTLAEVQVPEAMASRIQRSLEAAAATSQPARLRWPFWVPATCMAIGVILVAALLQTHVTRGKQAAQAAKMATSDSVPFRPTAQQPARIAAESSGARKASPQAAHQVLHARTHTGYRHAANLFNYPLTRQEKLLVKFVQTATPAELQTLNPEYQAKVEAQQEAEFAAYVNSGNNSSTQETTETAETNQSTQE